MQNINWKWGIAVILGLLLFLGVCRELEGFNSNGTIFVKIDEPRYGLRGELLSRRPISDYYIRPDRHVRVDDSGNEMYVSNRSPIEEGLKGCREVPCPQLGNKWSGYDEQDTCWNC